METIGLIAAMPQECQALLRCVDTWESFKLGSLRAYRFEILGRQCTLVESGIGLERAKQAAESLLQVAQPHVLVAFGIGGAVEPDLEMGDVIIATRCCEMKDGRPGEFRPLAGLSVEAWHTAAAILARRGAQLYRGTLLSTRGSQLVMAGPAPMEHPVLEMETAAVAQVAARARLGLVGVRAISDGPQAPLPFDLEAVTGEDYKLRTGELIKAVARHPGILLRAGSMLRNVRRAADHAAVAVVAALGQPAPLLAG